MVAVTAGLANARERVRITNNARGGENGSTPPRKQPVTTIEHILSKIVVDDIRLVGDDGEKVLHDMEEWEDVAYANLYANRLPLITTGVFMLWILAGSLVYHLGAELSYAQALFFALDGGLSIGFGADGVNCEATEDSHMPMGVCQFLTVVNIWGLALLLTVLLGALASAKLITHEEYAKERHSQAVSDVNKRALGDKMREHNITQHDHTNNAAVATGKPNLCALVLRPVVKYTLLYTLWVMFGVAFGMKDQGWTFWKSLLFAVAAMSTGGLVAPSTQDGPMVFTFFYCLSGVVVFALLIGAIGEVVLHRITEHSVKQRAKMTSTERHNMKTTMFQGRTDIDFPAFMQFTMLKWKMVSPKQLAAIKQAWDDVRSIDVDGGQGGDTIALNDLYTAQLFDMADRDCSGQLSRHEIDALTQLIVKKLECPGDAAGKILNTIRQQLDRKATYDNSGHSMTKPDFVRFLKQDVVAAIEQHSNHGGGAGPAAETANTAAHTDAVASGTPGRLGSNKVHPVAPPDNS